ncbi:pyrroline-5-carboxylate reductase [Shouchella sp. JSM 1781072]|uniref:pyrroline-5-carboxylate reductase n=1 Tax=Shouchella sp. JSM 1781072 TaxID=3344581 RepID=UPI0035C02B26
MPSILFIGAGRMAEAVFKGVLSQPEPAFSPVYVSNHTNKDHLHKLTQSYQIEIVENWTDVVANVDVILIAAPPSAHTGILEALHSLVDQQLVLTVAAGIGASDLEAQLPKGTATAWIMPNTAAQAGASISLYTYGSHVSDIQKGYVESLVSSIGTGAQLSESLIHELTAITGSAPAFVYEFVIQLEKIAQSFQLEQAQARELVVQMLAGSAEMLKAGFTPTDLRDQVTTPGGATEAGLKSLHQDDFEGSVARAVQAVTDHAKKKHN